MWAKMGHAVAQLVYGVCGKFIKSSGRSMALGLTQPLTEMSTRNIFWV
jgi:hypothetical protein